MAKNMNPTKVITGKDTRWSYCNIWDAKSINGGTPKYSVSLIIPKADTATVQKIRAAIEAAYRDFYRDAAFTHYVDKAIDLKQVVNTNKALVHCDKYGDKLLITCCIDNLLKGAVGQAVQNMNLMFGLDERAGLRLKPSAF